MIIDEADITKAIDDMADKLREADSTIKKHQETIQTLVDKVNDQTLRIGKLDNERETWSEAADSREKELNLYKNRKIVGTEMIEDYFGRMFEKELDKFLSHLHHTKRQEAESLLAFTQEQRENITKIRIEQENHLGKIMGDYRKENDKQK